MASAATRRSSSNAYTPSYHTNGYHARNPDNCRSTQHWVVNAFPRQRYLSTDAGPNQLPDYFTLVSIKFSWETVIRDVLEQQLLEGFDGFVQMLMHHHAYTMRIHVMVDGGYDMLMEPDLNGLRLD